MYNMDEKGSLLGYNNWAKVIVRHRQRTPTETQDGSREWITVVECISAGQFMLPPMIIYKGKGVAGPVLSMMRTPSLYTAIRDPSQKTLRWSGYITSTLGLVSVLLVHPGFYSWVATAPSTPFNLYAIQ